MQQTPARTGWVGWSIFAAVMLLIGGIMQGIYGLVALLNDEWVVWGNSGAVLIDVSAWGWIHLVLGILLVLVGLGILYGNVVARIFGVAIAGLSLLASFFALPLYPLWSLVVIAIDLLVIWALVVHGGELRSDHTA
jgi:uncharacterized membrane protein